MTGSPVMSRARGRKQAKKGVQLTIMVVGECEAAAVFIVWAADSVTES